MEKVCCLLNPEFYRCNLSINKTGFVVFSKPFFMLCRSSQLLGLCRRLPYLRRVLVSKLWCNTQVLHEEPPNFEICGVMQGDIFQDLM
jgi:hypothetical protein